MSVEEKKCYFLLKAVIFNYHGLDEDEQTILDENALALGALEELKWAQDFIAQDYYSAFERARDYLIKAGDNISEENRLEYLYKVWQANNAKGYISEMEATAMIKLAKDWNVEKKLIDRVRG